MCGRKIFLLPKERKSNEKRATDAQNFVFPMWKNQSYSVSCGHHDAKNFLNRWKRAGR